jgi:hypothetical protein
MVHRPSEPTSIGANLGAILAPQSRVPRRPHTSFRALKKYLSRAPAAAFDFFGSRTSSRLGATPVGAVPTGNGIRLAFSRHGVHNRINVDHLIGGAGFKVALSRAPGKTPADITSQLPGCPCVPIDL